MATTSRQRDSLDTLEDKIEYLLKFVTIISELVLLLGLAYAGFKLAHRGPMPETLDQIWLVSQVLALDLSAPGLFAMATRAREQGNEKRAKWAIRIAIVLIIMSILTMVEGAVTSYIPNIPQVVILYVTLVMMIIRAVAAVGYSVFRRLHKAANSPVVPAVAPSVEENAIVAQLENLQQQLLHVTAQLEAVKIAPVSPMSEQESEPSEDQIENAEESGIVHIEDYLSEQFGNTDSLPVVNETVNRKAITRKLHAPSKKTTESRSNARANAAKVLKKYPGIGPSELAQRAQISKSYASKILSEMA